MYKPERVMNFFASVFPCTNGDNNSIYLTGEFPGLIKVYTQHSVWLTVSSDVMFDMQLSFKHFTYFYRRGVPSNKMKKQLQVNFLMYAI